MSHVPRRLSMDRGEDHRAKTLFRTVAAFVLKRIGVDVAFVPGLHSWQSFTARHPIQRLARLKQYLEHYRGAMRYSVITRHINLVARSDHIPAYRHSRARSVMRFAVHIITLINGQRWILACGCSCAISNKTPQCALTAGWWFFLFFGGGQCW